MASRTGTPESVSQVKKALSSLAEWLASGAHKIRLRSLGSAPVNVDAIAIEARRR